MEWPAQSLDMNPTENVWKLLNERAKGKNRVTQQSLLRHFILRRLLLLWSGLLKAQT